MDEETEEVVIVEEEKVSSEEILEKENKQSEKGLTLSYKLKIFAMTSSLCLALMLMAHLSLGLSILFWVSICLIFIHTIIITHKD